MPSDEVAADIFAQLAPAREAFRSAVTGAVEELRTQIETQRPTNGRTARVAEELGAFAAGRIDADRFAELLDQRAVLDERAFALLERSADVLAAIAKAGNAPYRLQVPPSGDLGAELGSALAVAGRAFGAARVAELVRTGRAAEAMRDDAAGAFPFFRWTRAERRLAPPLLVEVNGGDLQAGALAAFLDGTQKIVLVVSAPAPPASLVRLITPGVFVMQTTDAADFGRLAAFDGPAVGALVPEGCACFVHDPAAGATLADRLTVKALPSEAPTRALGRLGTFQLIEELEWLRTLSQSPKATPATEPAPAPAVAVPATPPAPASAAAAPAPAPAAAAPADRLAAWLLQQADLSGTG